MNALAYLSPNNQKYILIKSIYIFYIQNRSIKAK